MREYTQISTLVEARCSHCTFHITHFEKPERLVSAIVEQVEREHDKSDCNIRRLIIRTSVNFVEIQK
jgi:hypothetical protein